MTNPATRQNQLPNVEIFLALLAWFGNALYAFGAQGGLLKFWSPAVVAFAMISFLFLHGSKRYGHRQIRNFVIIVVLTGWLFESISVATGYPFGGYYYTNIMAPFIGDVPVFVLPAYCVMGYVSWSLATLLVRPTIASSRALKYLALPALGAALMVVWDLSMDPLRATVEHRWIWPDGGPHFGIPVINYFGWFLVTWLMFLIFSFLEYRPRANAMTPVRTKVEPLAHELSIPLLYCGFAIEYMLNPFTNTAGTRTVPVNGIAVPVQEIFTGVALLSATTMIPIAAFSIFMILQTRRGATNPIRQRASAIVPAPVSKD